MRHVKSILGPVALAVLGATAHGQTPDMLIKVQDTVIGMGALEGINFVSINDAKMWSAWVATSYADTNRDDCILRNGFVTLREGIPMFAPPNSTLDDWISIAFTNRGDLGMLLKFRQGTASTEGAFWNLVPLAVKDEVIVAPELGAGTEWEKFEVVKMNANNTMFILGDVTDPTVLGTREDILMRLRLDDQGNILERTVLAVEGMFLPLLGAICSTLPSGEHLIALNDEDDFITYIGASGQNAIVINMETIVARESDPAPVPARTWRTLSQSKLAINDRGDWAITGALNGGTPTLDNTSYLVVKNGVKFAQEGEVIPTLSPFPLGSGGPAPLVLANNGDLFWRAAAINGQTGVDDAFLRNYTPIIQKNRTIVDGALVDSVIGTDHAFAVSPNGRFFLGRVNLQGIGSAVLFVDFGLVLELPGCQGNPGELSLASGEALVGHQIVLNMDNGQASGALPILMFSRQPRVPGSECGTSTPYGELLISPADQVGLFVLPTWNGTNPSQITLRIPNNIALVDSVFYAQGAFRDLSPSPTELFRMTNALRLEIGPP